MFRKSLGWLALSIASLILLSFTVTASAAAAGISVSPTSGGYGTSFTITANGFQKNGIVDTWVARPDGQVIGTGTVRADPSGQATFSITPALGWPAGTYIAVAHARVGGLELQVKFGFNGGAPSGGSSSSTSSSSTSTTLASAGMSVQPTSGDSTTTFVLSAGGFNPGEAVSVWAVAPNGVTAASGTLNANNQGAVQIAGQVPSTTPAGKYTAYAQGLSSGRKYSASFTVVVPTYPNWKGEYFNNQNLSGSPAFVRNDTAINFNWGFGSPGSGVNSDHFSVRWTRSLYLSGGTYQFTTTTDDGVRLWVNGNLIIDAWYDQSATHTGVISLAAGTYPIEMDYYENGGNAMAQLSWALTSSATTGEQPWTGYYYNNINLSGSPVLTRQDASLNFNWGGASPGAGVPGTYWSAKWDSTQYAPSAGNYTLTVTADDGVRVWVDGNLVIDAWQDQPPTTYTTTGYMNAGAHSVHVEYYQRAGGSQLEVGFNAS